MSINARLAAITALFLLAMGGAFAKDRNKLLVGTTGNYPPFSFTENGSELRGFEIDIARALCAKMRVECEFVTHEWESIIPGLLAHRFDAIMSSMSITEERKQQVAFTDKYYKTPASFVAKKGSTISVTPPEATKGLVIGGQDATTHAELLREVYGAAGATIRLYATQDEALLDLSYGHLDAVLADKLGLLEWLGNSQESNCCAIVADDIYDSRYLGENIGIALRKGDTEWRDQLNAAIKAIRDDGTYKKINDRYFPFDVY